MRDPIYRKRPVGPRAAVLGGERINDFIVLSEGLSNTYLLESAEGNLQVNAGMAFEAPIHRANFERLARGETRTLVLTQGHVDHVGGVDYFRQHAPGLLVIATAANTEHQAYDRRLSAFRGSRSAFAFAEALGAAVAYSQEHCGPPPPQASPTPDILFHGSHELTLGDLEVELLAIPGAETNDSLVVWLPQHRICLTGNLFGCPFGHFPNLVTIRGDRYRDPLTCAAAVEHVRALEPEMILYGHHAPVVGAHLIQEELRVLRDAIHFVHDATVAGMNAGHDVHHLMREISLPPELEVGEGYGKVSWSVRAIWEYYAGWFHHDSTTELFAVPRSRINEDLVELAGGPAALVARAREKLAGEHVEEAIHLLDIVLASGPTSEALDAMIEAHEKLRSASENFWLSAWLDHQLAGLRSRRSAAR